jgi:hypothetical protein
MAALFIAETDTRKRVAWVWLKEDGARTARALSRDHTIRRVKETDEVFGASRAEVNRWLKANAQTA